jgi:hypothetical protein
MRQQCWARQRGKCGSGGPAAQPGWPEHIGATGAAGAACTAERGAAERPARHCGRRSRQCCSMTARTLRQRRACSGLPATCAGYINGGATRCTRLGLLQRTEAEARRVSREPAAGVMNQQLGRAGRQSSDSEDLSRRTAGPAQPAEPRHSPVRAEADAVATRTVY